MARNCNCPGASCSCKIVAGPGIRLTGIGTEMNPFVVENTGVSVKNAIAVGDTPTVQMLLTGEGTGAEPLVISANVRIGLGDLSDVSGATPQPGEVPIWVIENGEGHWDYGLPPTTPPGAVTATTGLQGDGSGANPLRARTSGTWGTGSLAGYGADTGAGSPVYVDAAGQLRGAPWGSLPKYSSAGRPSARAGLVIYDTDLKAVLVGHDTGWEMISSATPVGMLMQYPVLAAPPGWLPCDGQSYLRTTYPTLAALLGARANIPGDSTRFRVPDLRGRVTVGVDGAQPEFDAIGKQGGAKTHTLTTAEMPAHTHRQSYNTGAIAAAGGSAVGGMASAGSGAPRTAEQSTSSAGGGLAHNNLQPYETVYYLIRAI